MSDTEHGSLCGIQVLGPYASWSTGPYAVMYYRHGPDWVQGRVQISRRPGFPQDTYFYDPVDDNAEDPILLAVGRGSGFIVHATEIPAILAALGSDA